MAITEAAALTLVHNMSQLIGWSVQPYGPGSGRIMLEGPENNGIQTAVIITFDRNADTSATISAKCSRAQTFVGTVGIVL